MMQDPIATKLLELDQAWQAHVMDSVSPAAGWPSRPMTVRHGKNDPRQEEYAASLLHPPDHDVDSAFAKRSPAAQVLEKAVGDRKPLPPDGHWITLHPNGPDAEGHPVYIVPNADGSHSIVRGAGGKLNGLRLTAVKSPEEYRKLGAERRKVRDEARKRHRELMKTQMGVEAYQAHSEEVAARQAETKSTQRESEKAFIGAVAKAQGIDPKTFEPSEEALKDVDPKIVERLKAKSHQAALTWANQVTERVKDVVLNALDTASQDALGDIGLPDLVSTATGDFGRGYQAKLADMAAANGLTQASARLQAKEVSHRGFLERSDYDLDAATQKEEAMARLQAGSAESRANLKAAQQAASEAGGGPSVARGLPTAPRVGSLGEAVEILKAQQQMEETARQAKAYRQDLERAENLAKLPKAAVAVAKTLSDEAAMDAVAKTLSEESMQKAMTRLISSANELEDASGTLQAHVAVGHSATFNALAQAVNGTTVDPLLTDVLGASVTAHLVAGAWRASMAPEEFEATKSALADQHIATQEALANKGVDRAEGYVRDAEAIEVDPQPTDALGLEAALADQAQIVTLARMARESVGVALGRVEAAAALNEAMLHTKTGPVQVSLGAISSADALIKIHALGLTRPSLYDPESGAKTEEGEFTLHSDGENRILELHKAGLESLMPKSDPERFARAKRSAAIKNGAEDEAGWLPEGLARRPASTFEVEPLTAHSIDNTLTLKGDEDEDTMVRSLREFVGRRIAHGVDALTVASDLSSVGFQAELGLGPDAQARYQSALSQVAPSYYDAVRQTTPDQAERAKRMDSASPEFQEGFAAHKAALRTQMESYADALEAADGEKADQQRIALTPETQDSLLQAVAADPRTQNAFLPLADVDTRSIRSFALEHILGVDPAKQEILSKVTPQEERVFRAWDALRKEHGGGGIFKAIQDDMKQRHEEDAGGSLFGGDEEPTPVSSLATVDLTNDASVVAAARENAQKLGYKLQVDPETGKMDYLELKAGHRFYGEGAGGRVVEYSPLTDETIARVARNRVKKALKQRFITQMQGQPDLAHFDPDTVMTGSNRWERYVSHMGGLKKATRAVQEVMAGHLCERFAKVHAKRTGKPLTVVQKAMTDADAHAQALMAPEAVEAKLQAARSQYAQVGKDRGGKFTAGSRREKVENREKLEAEGPQLLGESAKGEHGVSTKRASLGKAVEGALKGMMPYCPVDRPVDTATTVEMSGSAINRQRATKLILENKRQGLNLGAGSGKTVSGLGAFTHLFKQGKAKRALFVVPSNIVGQFGGEFLKYVDPSLGLRWHADPGASGDERRQALGDAGKHMVVMTPEALRDDVTKACAEHLGLSPKQAVEHLAGLPEAEVDKIVHTAMDAKGWNFDYGMFDESHRLLGRQGKPDAHMARIADSVGRKTPYYVYSTADPVKNDASEAWDILHKMDPTKYTPETRESFQRRYGPNTLAAGLALQREMQPYLYTAQVDTGVQHNRQTHLLDMTPAQGAEHAQVMAAYRQAKLARTKGDTAGLVTALKQLSPKSFGQRDESDEETAERLGNALGTLRETALNRVVNLHQDGAKLHWVDKYLGEHKGEPTVIFAHNLGAVQALRERLKASGHRLAVITGTMSTEAKDRAKNAFQPSGGEPSADILVCSDAAAMGANLQRGYHLINYDTPMTAMLHEQRIAREVRTGQKNAVTVHDLVANSSFDRRNRKRLEDKGALRELMTADAELIDDSGFASRLARARERRLDHMAEGKSSE